MSPTVHGSEPNRPLDRVGSAAKEPSATPDEYEAAYIGHNVPSSLPGGEVRTSWLTMENCGTKTWVQGDAQLSVNLDGGPVFPLELPHSVGPGERVTLSWVLRIPAEAGRHEFRIDLVGTRTASVNQPRRGPLRVPFDVVNRSAHRDAPPERSGLRESSALLAAVRWHDVEQLRVPTIRSSPVRRAAAGSSTSKGDATSTT